MRYLVINADDFGMTNGTNSGIVQAIVEGMATDTSILACGGAFDDAVRLARENGIKEAGAHLSLTEVRPLVLRRKIKNYAALAINLFFGRLSEDEVRSEFRAQLDRIRSAGVEITHLDSHENIHILPRIQRIFAQLAAEYKIPAMRLLREEGISGAVTPARAYRSLVSRYFSGKNESVLDKAGLFHPGRVLGFLDSGRLSENLLLAMLRTLKDGVTELIAHPGFLSPELVENYSWHINCEDELYALTSPRVRRIIDEKKIKLVSYKEAADIGAEGGSSLRSP